jgi:hypothetical protein
VEHSGFTSLNNQRLAKFVGAVANPDDVLLHRKKEVNTHAKASKKRIHAKPIAPEELERTNMEDLSRELFKRPSKSFGSLKEKTLSLAME